MKPLNSYDKKGILAEEVFVEIFEQEDAIRRAQMLLSFQDRAKELGVKGQFDTMVKAFEKAEKETQQKQRQSQTLIENWTNFTGKYDSMKCGSWLAADNGIRTFNKDYSNEVIVCYHPIMPIGRMRNLETGEEQIRLAYKRNHRWTEIAVPKDIISSASKIVSLSKLGVAVTSENAKLLVKYLSDVENMNDDEIPIQRSSAKLGWIGDGFLPYDTEIIFDGDMAFGQVYESIREHGSWQEWLEHVKALRRTGRLEIKFSLAASFASILVNRLGALPFIVDLWGETEGGKSVSMMLAASIWANPDNNQYIGDFKTTDTQLEIRADLLNHLPLMLDDTSKTSSRIRDNFEGVVYDLCSGKGKSRSNKELGIRRENRWKNTILTNGERPLTSYVSQGGAINRILEIECGEKVYQDPQYTAELLKKNYGFAGKRFVQVIKKMGAEELREIQQKLQKELFSVDKMQKQSIAMWKRAEGAIYKRFADNPDAYRCEVVEELNPDAEVKQFRKEDITSIEIGLDFGGNQSGHSFVARGYTDNYRDVIALKSRRIMAKDENEDIDSNMLDKMFCDFVGEVIEEYGVVIRHGDYVEYCNVETVYYDNAETVLGNSIRNAVEKQYPWISVRKAKKATINDRIRCTVKLMGAGRFFITKDCESLKTAFSDAVWNKDVKDKDDRLDDGSTDIDSLDAFEYTIERDMKYLIEEVEDV